MQLINIHEIFSYFQIILEIYSKSVIFNKFEILIESNFTHNSITFLDKGTDLVSLAVIKYY